MALTLPQRALLVKLYYLNHYNARAAIREFRRLNQCRRGPLTPCAVRRMIRRFEETGSLGVGPGRGRKPIGSPQVTEVATAVVEQAMGNAVGSCSARAVSRQMGVPPTTVWKILRKILHFYPFKITRTQELLPQDFGARMTFALTFLARMELDASWPWMILWGDEAHFHLNGAVNTHNCRVWASQHPHAIEQRPLHSPKVTVWCGFTASFIIGPFFFEEMRRTGPVTCSITAQRYRDMIHDFVVPQLQQRECLDSVIFMQDGAPPHIGRSVQGILREHFTEARVISRAFPTAWPPRSPDLTPCDFWLWGFLKDRVYQGHIANLAELKDSITQKVRNITSDQLRSAVEHTVHRMQFVAHREGQHVEQYGP